MMRYLTLLAVLVTQSAWALDFDEYHEKYWLKAKAQNGMFDVEKFDTEFGSADLPKGYVQFYKSAMKQNAKRFDGLIEKMEPSLQEPMKKQLNEFIVNHTIVAITPLVLVEEMFANRMSSRTFGTMQGRKFLMRDVNNRAEITEALEKIEDNFEVGKISFRYPSVDDARFVITVKVNQIIDDTTFRGAIGDSRDNLIFRGWPTSGMVDEKYYQVDDYFAKTGTTTYTTILGANKTVAVWEHQPKVIARVKTAFDIIKPELNKPVSLQDLLK